jgi:RHS repeat-associated protein
VSSRSVTPRGDAPNDLNYSFAYRYNRQHPHRADMVGDWTYTHDGNGNVTRKNLGGGVEQDHTTNDFHMQNPNRPTSERDGTDWLTRETGTTSTTSTTVGTSNESPYDIETPRDEEIEEIDMLFTWNEENRLVSSTVSGETTSYLYDAGGERTIKKGQYGETTYVNRFFQMQNRDVVTKHIFVGESRIVSKLSHHDEFGDLDYEKNNVYYYHPDHLGNTTYITDTEGDQWEHFEYTPYGETWVTEENRTHSFGYRFTVKELDTETNLYYFGARYLDAKTSRWLSVDPAFEEYLPVRPVSDREKEHNRNLPGEGGVFSWTNLNVYHYAGNNPIKYTDPDGERKGTPFELFMLPIELMGNGITKGVKRFAIGIGLFIISAGGAGWHTPNSGGQEFADSVYEGFDANYSNEVEAVYGITTEVGLTLASIYISSELSSGSSQTSKLSGANKGTILNSVDDVISNPSSLQGKSLSEVQSVLKNTKGWVEGTLSKGRSAGKGWTFRQLNAAGTDFTDLYIQYSPGSPRHFGGKPYWKVSSGNGGTQWFIAE